ncbi:MAG: NAD(P)H-hydrate dehydratase [Candidatus Bathyarchaeia archaeon]
MQKDAVTCEEMRALELNSEYLGITPLQLMENAGKAVADEIVKRFEKTSKVIVFAGVGRNGGDGMVSARHLADAGFKIEFHLVGKEEEITEDAVLSNWKAIKNMGSSINLREIPDSSLIHPVDSDVIVDALLGIGIRGKLRQPILQAVKAINESKGFKIAIDVPTGIDADSGDLMDNAVRSNLTITFHKKKTGFEKAKECIGELKVVKIGIPPEAELYSGPGDVEFVTVKRDPNAHKGDFGRLLIIGGSETFSGAPVLVALAALRVGVDLAYIAAPEKTAYAISSISPNLITIKLSGNHLSRNNLGQIKAFVDKATAVVVGPGLGTHKATMDTVQELVSLLNDLEKPLLLDADALKALDIEKFRAKSQAVLTPHQGEFEILTGKKLSNELESKIKEVRNLAMKINSVVLLKGRIDIISDGEKVKLNLTGNPGMTVGGTGDVLSGIVGGFLSQKFNAFRAAVAGAFVNGAAGDFAYFKRGFHILATDLIEEVPRVLIDPMEHKKIKEVNVK